jgi:tyrosinase
VPASDVDLTAAFQEHEFAAGPPGGSMGFGGPKTKFHHSRGSHGALESKPHDLIDDDIGGLWAILIPLV